MGGRKRIVYRSASGTLISRVVPKKDLHKYEDRLCSLCSECKHLQLESCLLLCEECDRCVCLWCAKFTEIPDHDYYCPDHA